MTGFSSFVQGAVLNLVVLTGLAFMLSRGIALLRGRRGWRRSVIIGLGFGISAIGSMMVSFPIAAGIIADLRNAVIGLAGLIGGPWASLVAAAIAVAYRFYLGGHAFAGSLGIFVTAGLTIGFVRLTAARGSGTFAILGAILAVANALLPLVASLSQGSPTVNPWRVAAVILGAAIVLYPLSMALIGELLTREFQRIDEEARLRSVNADLEAREQRFHNVFNLSCVAMAWFDPQGGRLIRVNPQFVAFSGYSEAELLAMTYDELCLAEDRLAERAAIAPVTYRQGTSFTDERRYRRKDATIVWGSRTVTLIEEAGGARYAFAIVQDITERKRSRNEIAYLAARDPLTGLINRREFRAELDRLVTAAPSGAVLYLDLDGFKEINDTLGHVAGDGLLTDVAERLCAAARPGTRVGRLGGDQFAVLCDDAGGRDDVGRLAADLVRRLRDPFDIGGHSLSIGASIGIALFSRDTHNADEIWKQADMALHAAKAEGGNHFRFYQPEMSARVAARQALKLDLARALAEHELTIEYQPVIDLKSEMISGFEALLRWRHPTRGLLQPAEFIPLAEETGLIAEIGKWVLTEGCRMAQTWPEHVRLAVNVSPVQFAGGLPLSVAAALEKSGLAARRLELEITESVLLGDTAAHLAELGAIRDLGVSIALDDFGTGYSSLSYLQRFPFDRIKIDRRFVAELMTSAQSRAVVQAVITLGHSLGMRVTAEGIETTAQCQRVFAEGCDEGQGYLFSRAVPPLEARRLLAREGSSTSNKVA